MRKNKYTKWGNFQAGKGNQLSSLKLKLNDEIQDSRIFTANLFNTYSKNARSLTKNIISDKILINELTKQQ